MTDKHTPGPWRAQLANRQNFFFGIWAQVTKTGSMEIARVSGLAEFDRANAHLIAAAPELLEACKKMIFEMRQLFGWNEDDMNKWESVIKKAEGAQ